MDIREQAADLVADLPAQTWHKTTWNNIPAVHAKGAGKEAIVAKRDDVLWGIVADGKSTAHLFEQIERGTTIGDFAGTTVVRRDP